MTLSGDNLEQYKKLTDKALSDRRHAENIYGGLINHPVGRTNRDLFIFANYAGFSSSQTYSSTEVLLTEYFPKKYKGAFVYYLGDDKFALQDDFSYYTVEEKDIDFFEKIPDHKEEYGDIPF